MTPRSGDSPTPALTLDSGPDAEVRAGLKCEQDRLVAARANQDYYDGEGENYIPRRDGETESDYALRPKRALQLVAQAVEALTSDSYSPAPQRTLEGAAGAATWLEGVYADAGIDAVLTELEALAAINGLGCCQFQATGDDARPFRLVLWGAEELAVWTDPDDATRPWAVCTIDRQDEQTRYRLWDAVEVRTYLTEKLKPGQTAGGRTATLVDRQDHDYGCLPFAFVHYRRPTRKFWQDGPGEAIRKANGRVDVRLSELDEAIERFNLRPVLYATNVDSSFRPVSRPGAFFHLPALAGRNVADDDATPEPSLNVLQANVNAAEVWADVTEYIYAAMEGVGIPRTAIRMEQAGIASGIALVIEQAPLLKRAMKRRPHLRRTEAEFTRVLLTCGGNHYGKAELTAAAADVRLSLLWPEPYIPFPDPVRDQLDQDDIAAGRKSQIQVVMQRYDMTRDQAIAHLKRVAEDNASLAAIFPEMPDPTAPAVPPATTTTPTDPQSDPQDPSETDGP